VSWFRVDDKAAFHKKVLKAHNDGFGALVRMGCWSSDHLTDGRIPIETALLIAPDDVLQRLCSVGFLESDGDDFIIHDFLDYNPTAEEVRADREAKSAARREAGKAGASARWNGKNGKRDGKTIAKPKQTPWQKDGPVPDPVPLALSLESSPSGSVSDARVDLGEPDSDKQKRIVDQHYDLAMRVFGELNAARSRVRSGLHGLRPTYSSLGGIAARLAAGCTLEECLLVVAHGEAECARKPEAFEWFDAVSPWRPENFQRRIAKDPKGGKPAVIDADSAEKGRSLF
jgi:hypothetical protein